MSVRDSIRYITTETNLADPHEIAEKLIADLDASEYEDALKEVLPDFIRTTLARMRMVSRVETLNQLVKESKETPAGKARGKVKQVFRSRKVAGYQSWGAALRAQRVRGDGDVWKTLNDCTLVDLVKIVETNRTQAERTLATASRYERLSDVLRKSGKSMVSELSDAELESAFSSGDE